VRREGIGEAPSREDLVRVRRELYPAGRERRVFGVPLEHGGAVTDARERYGRSKPAEATANDNEVKGDSSLCI
jgi:hypothetical protein